ncbi:MAG: HEPN domain-containing protein [candidate division NC10 bacterium]|nr:HEPN domain-containing protein [Candidatus Rokubacteria bacterium]MBI2560896.1 HEPN domain-containing protein [candidate division NC10 bacterium]
MSRAPDWFSQAERDLGQAEDSRRAGRHEWACFAAHQAAEKAVKALHLHLGQEAWGHVVAKLLRDLPASAGVAAALAPFEHYGPLQSEGALRFAGAISAG